ncbi:MAG: hypothetical protein P1V81_15350 [Planctomycetota bacterium]|nr:hypothetical protein [Planctomycetota bacterium]
MERGRHAGLLLKAALVAVIAAGCALFQEVDSYLEGGGLSQDVGQHRWWNGFGPVLSHEDFPADCSMCHLGNDWHELVEDFEFDHGLETGHELAGAHTQAACLRCHNDRGPVRVFEARGCTGCHEDVHQGSLGASCSDCHGETDWSEASMLGRSAIDRLHRRSGFELVGAHALTSCDRCHAGSSRGLFGDAPKSCEACHVGDLQAAKAPDHISLGWVQRCDECHQPLTWQEAEL